MQLYSLLLLLCYSVLFAKAVVEKIDVSIVQKWASNIKKKLVDDLAMKVTAANDIEEEFSKYAIVDEWKPEEMLTEFKKKMTEELKRKEIAVRELMENGKNAFDQFYSDKAANNNSCFHRPKDMNDPKSPCFVQYMQAWRGGGDDAAVIGRADFVDLDVELNFVNYTRKLQWLTRWDPRFPGKAVWVNGSAMHVPKQKWERDPKVLEGINATGEWFDVIVKQNREKRDPDLSYQFFCSLDGFMRFNPAESWTMNPDGVDMYDCRLQPWFVNAINSPKQMLIVLDISGSMLGQRIEIAKQTVEMIMDTLSDRDYFNMIMFNRNATFAAECFKYGLIQATERNKKLLRGTIDSADVREIAMFKEAFKVGFETLTNESDKTDSEGTRLGSCNQAIMLLTDGASETYEEVFKELNPDKKIRLFAYLIGIEVTEFREVRWMACYNKGFFVHISSLADVQSKIQHYVKVLSRPLALHYADKYAEAKKANKPEFKPKATWTGLHYSQLGATPTVTVSLPIIFHGGKTANETRVLGVVGTHIPITRLKQSAPDYMLGGQSYSFLVDANAYVMFHPQHRPQTPDGEIKRNFNSIDILEVEVTFDGDKPPSLMPETDGELRENLVKGAKSASSNSITRRTKQAFEFTMRTSPKRVFIQNIKYYFDTITDTEGRDLYSLGIGVPDGKTSRVEAKEGFRYEDISRCLEGTNWKLHEKLFYCRREGEEIDKEAAFRKDTAEAEGSGQLGKECAKYPWLIRNTLMNAKATCDVDKRWINVADETAKPNGVLMIFLSTHAGLTRYADMNLSDIEYTSEYPEPPPGSDDGMGTYVDSNSAGGANRSAMSRDGAGNQSTNGLRDAIEELEMVEERTYMHFIHRHTKSYEEEYYRRTIRMPPEMYIFDVDIDNVVRKTSNNTFGIGRFTTVYGRRESHSMLMKVTKALYLAGDTKAPLGVVGFEMLYNNFSHSLHNAMDKVDLSDPDRRVFVLDENGFILFSSENDTIDGKAKYIGNFFGVFEPCVMQSLLDKKVYTKTVYMDYQALCENVIAASSTNRLLSPIIAILNFLAWLWRELSMLIAEYSILSLLSYQVMPSEAYTQGFQYRPKGTSCDKLSYHYNLKYDSKNFDKALPINYTCVESAKLTSTSTDQPQSTAAPTPDPNCKKEMVVTRVEGTNMVLLVLHQDPECSRCTPDSKTGCQIQYSTLGRRALDASDKFYPENLIKPLDGEPAKSSVCTDARMGPKYRKVREMDACYSHHPKENVLDCSRGVRIANGPGLLILTGSVLFSGISWRRLLRGLN